MEDIFSDANALKPNWMGFNVKEEDKIVGTFIGKRQVKSTYPGKEGKLEWKYTIKADSGTSHDCDDFGAPIPTPIKINAGEIWNVGKDSIDEQMKFIPLGAKIGIKLVDIVPSQTKGWKPAKIVKVFAQKNPDGSFLMDADWIAEQEKEAALSGE